MSRASLTLLVSLSLGLGLTACGDDSEGGGGETDTDASTSGTTAPTGPTTDTPTSDGPTTVTPTTGSTSTTDPDPDTGSETTDPTIGETEGDTEAVVPMDADFRVNSLGVQDPPLTLVISLNDIAGSALTDSLTMDTDKDGDLDLGFVLQFRPLDQSDGGSDVFGFANASCTAPEDSSTCDVLGETTVAESTYLSSSEECYAADPANLSGADITPTAGPCFLAEYDSVTIAAGLFALPLEDVQVAATYVGDPAGNLISGNIQGFVTNEVAAVTEVTLPGQDPRPLVDLLNDADADAGGTGWVFHLSFTAVPTEWTGA